MSANLTATVNGTQTSGSSTCNFKSTAAIIGQTLAYCLLFVVSLTGNSLIGLTVYKTKTMRKPINFFIVNMAMSDLLLPIILFPTEITEIHVGSWLMSGPLGQALCKLATFLTDVSTAVSIQSLVLIAVDRFGAVLFPLRSQLISTKLCRFFIPATWIIAMAIHSPYLFVFKLVEYPGGLVCLLQWNEVFRETLSLANYFLAVFIVLVYIPLLLIAIIYSVILLKLKSQKIPGEQSVNAREQRAKRERNVLKMSIAIVLVFAICFLPLTTYGLLLFFPPDSTMISSCSFQYFCSISLFLARSNCAINPFICFIFSGNYRQGLKNLLSCFSADTRANQVAPVM